jgi:hypothetical protein
MKKGERNPAKKCTKYFKTYIPTAIFIEISKYLIFYTSIWSMKDFKIFPETSMIDHQFLTPNL